MLKWVSKIYFFFLPFLIQGQTTNISGVVNVYSKVTLIDTANYFLTLQNPANYNVGDICVIIQMKGAIIDSSNTSTFGSVTNYNSAGNYEFVYIQAICGTKIYLNKRLTKTYDVNSAVQLVKAGVYQNANVTGDITCTPWNSISQTGGVIFLYVKNNLTLNSNITADGAGYFGGHCSANFYSTTSLFYGYYYDEGGGQGGGKGESYAYISLGKTAGRGAIASGGGGGNFVNFGGGGGANSGYGGTGNNGNNPSSTNVGGVGGYAYNYYSFYANNKVFMGGGGGAGQQNDGACSAGANGGGIIFIKANMIVNSGKKISCNGNDAASAANDGAGGGGAGGSILIDLTNPDLSTTLSIDANGGKGGDNTYGGNTNHGVGAGGGGGFVATNPLGIYTLGSRYGGNAGYATNPQSLTYNTHAGATDGSGGISCGNCIHIIIDTISKNPNTTFANAGPDVYSCKKDLIQLNGTGNGTSFTWSPIKYITNNIIPNPVVNPDTNITYLLTVWNGPCVSRDTMKVFVTSIDAIINNNDTSICLGDTVQFTTFINGNSFNWNPTIFLKDTHSVSPFAFPDTTIKYFLTVTRGSCIKQDSVTINVVKNLVANAGSDQQICAGNGIQLSSSGPIGAAFSWLPNYALSNNAISNPYANPVADTSYFLKVQLGKNCVGYDTVRIKVNPNPTIDAGLDQNICREPFAIIGVSSILADSFFWSPPAGLSDINILQTQASPTANSTYFIKAIIKNTGCFNFDTVNVSLIKPTAIFNSDLQMGQAPFDVHFINSSVNSKNYLWDFGDTTATSSQINPDHIFTKEGLYKVILVAENNGCTDTAYTMIQVSGGLFVFAPNAFTPNADGLNDEFVISYTSGALRKMHGSIWNRWGAKIYEFDMPGGKWWDGKVNGNFVQPDTYVYIIEATNWNDVTKTFSGNFTLLR